MNRILVTTFVALVVGTFTSSLLNAQAQQFREWTFQNGNSTKLKLENAYSDRAYFTDKRRRPVSAEIIAFIESDQADIVYWSRERDQAFIEGTLVPSEFTHRFRRDAQRLQGGTLVDVDWEAEAEPEFYGIYTTASWCGPCREFTPTLVQYYNSFKVSFGDQFEFVLCSWDRVKADMIKYMKDDRIPWYGNWKQRQSRFWSQYQADGIPCLVIADRNGYILSHSYVENDYRGPREVMTDMTKLLAYASFESGERLSVPTPGVDIGKLRSAINERIRKAQAEGSGINVALVHAPQGLLDEVINPDSPEQQIKVKILISKLGVVKSVSLVSHENSRLWDVLSRALLLWQFLPAVRSDGTVQETEAVLPMKLNLKEEYLASSDREDSRFLASSRSD